MILFHLHPESRLDPAPFARLLRSGLIPSGSAGPAAEALGALQAIARDHGAAPGPLLSLQLSALRVHLAALADGLSPAVRMDRSSPAPLLQLSRALYGQSASVFLVEPPPLQNESATLLWCSWWRERLRAAGGPASVSAFHTAAPLAAQRETLELLCRRIGVDLAEVSLSDSALPCSGRVPAPDPSGPLFEPVLATIAALGLAPAELLDFSHVRPLAPRDFAPPSPECAEGFVNYGEGHFQLHPPAPGGVASISHPLEDDAATHFHATISLPNVQSPPVRFGLRVVSPDGSLLAAQAATLSAGESRSWSCRLPRSRPAGGRVELSTEVAEGPTHAYAWAIWRNVQLVAA